ncbi:unnamed protein product, partial [Ectocarpus sp. 13 AM-2016]
PLAGPESGGTVVTVTGMGFVDVHAIMCEFGSLGTLVPGRWMDSTTVTCVSPPHMPGAAILRLSVNGQQFIETGLAFQYLIESTVRAIAPSSGPQQGGTVVEVDGTGFVNSTGLSCRLAGRRLPATFVDSGRVRCITPTSATSLAMPLEVSNNGIDFTNSSTVHFTFVPALDIRHLWPMSGPIGGGTSVSVYGAGFASGKSKVLCIFRGDRAHMTLATVHSDDELSCPTPPLGDSSPTGATVRVELTNNNGVDRVASPINFSYVPPIHLFSVSPSHSGEEGGVTAVVTGENFLPSTSLSCRFGGQDATPAAFISSKQVSCLVPESQAGPRQVSLTVSNNGQDCAARSPLVYTYLSAFTLTSNEPSAGPVDGGTDVLLAGTGLSQTGPWACRFGSFAASPGEFLSSDVIRCTAPPSPDGPIKVEVSVSNNLLEFSAPSATTTFEYHPQARPERFHPRAGPLSGGTVITVEGATFSATTEQLACRFGRAVVKATLQSSPQITCQAPPSSSEKNVPVQVTINGEEWEDVGDGGLMFRYYQAPEVEALYPSTGPSIGGTHLSVFGRHFSPIAGVGPVLCRVGNSSGTAVHQCFTPAESEPGTVHVEVTLNGVDYTAQEIRHRFLPTASIVRLDPGVGLASGGTPVVIEGSGF